ncbi:uncharacterized protein LOC129700311 isoform X2 [Leucoraja erinacea]|uniref:uncharacterized protein LOC129700311 isoform X2 n=1 Tax=Leucoraja erinaceus TaxID=7782 RepID=UPI002454E1A6|nr:uncharacterized protein LOC129700311 isoform X2 [Leucoraja erinacea]
MDKVLVDGVPTANHWISVNDVIRKRWSLNDTGKSTLQQEWNNSIKLQHPEEMKLDTHVFKIPHLGSIVSKRKAFFESHMKLSVPVTKEKVKLGKMPATLKVHNPNTAGSSIMEGVQGPGHYLKNGENAEIIITKSECNRFGPIQKHPVVEKRRQLIGLYQAICETVRCSPFDSRQTISKEVKEKTSPTLQERLRCLLIEDAGNQEENELRSTKQNPEQNDYIIDSTTESRLTGHLSINPLNKYHKAGCLEPKSAFNQKRTNHVPRVPEAGISWQRSLPLDKAHGSSALKNTANNEFPQNHRDIFGRTIWENPTDEHRLTFPANQHSANQHSAKGKTANSEIENEPTAVGGAGSPLESTASKAHLVSQDKINSLYWSANQSVSHLGIRCEVNRDQEPKVMVCSGKVPLNDLVLQENPNLKPGPFPFSPVNTPRINQTSNQQTIQIASQLGSAADIDHSEIRPFQSLVLCSLQKQRAKSLSQLESMNSGGATADEVIQRPFNNSTEDSNPNLQLKSNSLTKLKDDGEREFGSPCLRSQAPALSINFVSSGSTRMSQVDAIRQHLQSLETDYQNLVALLSRESRPLPLTRKSKQKGQNAVKNGKLWAQLRLQRQKDICIVQQRFAHLEAHVLLLVRNVAHLTEEIDSQNSLLQKIHSFQLELKSTLQACNIEVGDVSRSSIKQDSSSISECSLSCGERPTMMTIFLKKLGYEQYVPHFRNAGIGFTELPHLQEERLEKLGIPLGPSLRILQEVRCTSYV